MVEEESPLRSPFDELIGTEWLDDDPDHARVRLQVREDLLQPTGLLHGGVISSLVESICSRATAIAVHADGMAAMGQAVQINFIRAVTGATLEVEARARHRGRATWVWEAEARDAEGKTAALAQMTIAVRPIRRSGS
jgi:1,4-dihydroxy-2-naphthoyl-CoA hydrolase